MRVAVIGAGRIGALHAQNLAHLSGVDEVLVCDADAERSARVVETIAASGAPASVHTGTTLLAAIASGIDATVIATATPSHAGLISESIGAGVPVFCEKPLAGDIASAYNVAMAVRDSNVAVQLGFQRRYDSAFMAIHDAVQKGDLGFVHTVRSCTLDEAPPPAAAYDGASGGIYRDCNIHDIDAVRYVTGREVVEVCATGSIRSGEKMFIDADDPDTAAAIFTMDDGALALISGARYNAAGYDVRMEVHGSEGAMAAGLDDRYPIRSAEPGVTWPSGPPAPGFIARFLDAYRVELEAFLEVAAGKRPSACTANDGLEAQLIAEACNRSRLQRRTVTITEVRDEFAATAMEGVEWASNSPSEKLGRVATPTANR